MLAIAARSFGTLSQTFVRDHVEMFAPDRTVLVCQDDTGLDAFAQPSLAHMDSHPPPATPPRGLGERARNALRARWRAYVAPGLGAGDRRRVARFLREHGVTVMMAEFGHVGVDLLGACEDAGVRLFTHFHGHDATARPARRHIAHEYRRLFRNSAGAIAPSHDLGAKLIELGLPPEKLFVSPNGIDPDRFTPGPAARAPRIIAVGRLVPKKAPHITIEAFARMSPAVAHVELDIIGDGPMLERCRQTVARLGLEGRVHLLGARAPHEVAERIRSAMLFAQHSVVAPDGDAEGFGITVIEAMACETPVAVTIHNGFRETVVDGVTGLLTPEYDIDAMAAAMERILANPAMAAEMGRAGRERVLQLYTHAAVRKRLHEILGQRP